MRLGAEVFLMISGYFGYKQIPKDIQVVCAQKKVTCQHSGIVNFLQYTVHKLCLSFCLNWHPFGGRFFPTKISSLELPFEWCCFGRKLSPKQAGNFEALCLRFSMQRAQEAEHFGLNHWISMNPNHKFDDRLNVYLDCILFFMASIQNSY